MTCRHLPMVERLLSGCHLGQMTVEGYPLANASNKYHVLRGTIRFTTNSGRIKIMAKEDEIRLIAYNIWEQESCPSGKSCEHWFRAEAIWRQQQKDSTVAINTKTRTKEIGPKTKKTLAKTKA